MAPTIDHFKPKTIAQQQTLLEQKRAFLAKHPAATRFLFEPNRLWGLIVTHRYIPPAIDGSGSDVNEYDDLRLSFQSYKQIAYTILFGDKSAVGGGAEGEEEGDSEPPVVANSASLSEKEKELIFFRHPFLSPKTFLMFERSVDNFNPNVNRSSHNQSLDKGGNQSFTIPETVPAVPLYTFIAKKMLLFRMRIALELFATVPPPVMRVGTSVFGASLTSPTALAGGDGSLSTPFSPHFSSPLTPATIISESTSSLNGPRYCAPSPSSPLSNGLTQEDVEAFIKSIVPNIRLVRDMPAWLLPYYLCHASRKIMFMLDSRGSGAISIEALMMSEVFSELIRMYESEMRDAVVTFPVGCALEVLPSTVIAYAKRQHDANVKHKADANISAAQLQSNGGVPDWVVKASNSGDEDLHLRCSVEDYENEGNDLADQYTVSVVCPKEYRDAETGIIEVFTVVVPRSSLVWCPSTTAYIPPELSAVTNWFSLPLMYRIYEHFTMLDVDSDGVLSLDEFKQYSNGSYTDLACRRVFDVHVRDAGGKHVMDYKSYLTFVVATEHVGTPQGKKYLWEVLDIEHTKDKISVEALRQFCKESSEKLAQHNLMKITPESILSEIIDMINPAWHEWITKDDIDRCKQHQTVLPILLSHRNFYAYDCREQSAAQPSGEYVQ